MRLSIETCLSYASTQPCDVLLQIEVASEPAQVVLNEALEIARGLQDNVRAGEEGIGVRRWIRAGATLDCTYRAEVEITRTHSALDQLAATPVAELPADVIKYLMPSRYCHPEHFLEFVGTHFGSLAGGALIAALHDWIARNFTYDAAASPLGTTATDSFTRQAGVCRDYAHVLITFARAAGIPARFASVYAPDVQPQDFHAVAEVYLDHAWHIVDATGMASAQNCARICVGRDAADASFMTSYGWIALIEQSVTVRRITS